MISKYYDKILLGSSLLVLLVVFVLAAFRPDPQPITEFVDIPALRPENTFVVSDLAEVDLSIPEWGEAPPQSAGPEWIFDVFTPSVILFDENSGEFVLPGDPSSPVPQGFGIELVSIQEELYRIQLVAHFGQGGSALVTLENRETGRTVTGREGQSFAEMGIVIRSVRTEKVRVDHTGETPVTVDVAFVVLQDERLGQEVTLRSDVRKKDSEVTAVFRASAEPDTQFRAQAGDLIRHAGAIYRVEALNPPSSALITRIGDEGTQETTTRTLRVTRTATGSTDGVSPQSPGASRQGANSTPRTSP